MFWRVGNSIAQMLSEVFCHLAEALGLHVLQWPYHGPMWAELNTSCEPIAPASLHHNQ